MARPDGRRCLVVASHGTTVSRLRSGHVLHRFPSALPNGARARGVAAPAHVFCILDAVFHEADQTYYVLDMMSWRGYSLYDCAAEFRFFWVQSKLAEAGACGPPSHFHRYRFAPVPALAADRDGLWAAYAGPVPYARDGLLLYNRQAHYSLGLTPLALLWKDNQCSRFFIDTDAEGDVPQRQQVVLELQPDGTVTTSDDPPVVLATMPKAFLEQNAKHLRSGTLLRFAIGEEGLSIVDGQPVAHDIVYQGLANQRRGGAHSCTKILFQDAARHGPLAFEDLVAAAQSLDSEEDIAMASTPAPLSQ
eukprot:SM000079S22410  [mRNA]  locus=s79:78003:79786:- [translate_table: standard]